MRSEGAFAHLAGVAPIPASSGRTHRHRINRGGDRAANNALHTIVLTRMRFDERTRTYVARRTKEGLSKNGFLDVLRQQLSTTEGGTFRSGMSMSTSSGGGRDEHRTVGNGGATTGLLVL